MTLNRTPRPNYGWGFRVLVSSVEEGEASSAFSQNQSDAPAHPYILTYLPAFTRTCLHTHPWMYGRYWSWGCGGRTNGGADGLLLGFMGIGRGVMRVG